jgi:hypothetical protein
MIQPLRQMHRTIFFALGIALPVLFIAGLASRHAPLPAVGTVENKPAQRNRGAEFVLNHGSAKFTARLVENKKGGQEREFRAIPASEFLAPDVFVYWSETQPGASLSPNAKLLGKLGPDELYRIPSGSGGYFVLYSVAQNEVVGSVPVGAAT